VSLLVTVVNGDSVDVGLVERERMTGLPLIFGNGQPITETFVQSAGTVT
jgi:hypothetical protein